MGRAPCCDKANVKKGPWSPEEDAKLKEYIEKNGTGGNWIALPQKAGLKRCGKSCRLRWLNYLRPNIKHGEFSDDEDRIICTLFASIGSRWSIIAAQLPGRTDNDIKNYWNTKLKKKLFTMVPQTQRKPHHHHIINHYGSSFSSLLQSYSPSSPSPSSPSSTLLYNCSNNTYQTPAAARSFTYFDHQSAASYNSSSFSNSSNSNSCNIVQQPQESLLGPMQHSYHQLQDGLQMFGNEAANSCSSSDGSNCSNQINNQNQELEHEYGEQIGMHQAQGYNNFYNNEADESQNKLLASNNIVNNGWSETVPLDYGFEEIKQLISTSSCNSFIF